MNLCNFEDAFVETSHETLLGISVIDTVIGNQAWRQNEMGLPLAFYDSYPRVVLGSVGSIHVFYYMAIWNLIYFFYLQCIVRKLPYYFSIQALLCMHLFDILFPSMIRWTDCLTHFFFSSEGYPRSTLL